MLYNGDFKGDGLQNFMPDCPRWGQPFFDGTNFTSHWHDYNSHAYTEAYSGGSYWRGYLKQGKYGSFEILGCGAVDLRKRIQISPYHFHHGNQLETWKYWDNSGDETCLKSPPFVWRGSPIYAQGVINAYQGGNFADDVPLGTYKKRTPLWHCPQARITAWYPWQERIYAPTHRMEWTVMAGNSPIGPPPTPFAGNIGFTDASVRYMEKRSGENIDPMR